MNALAAIRPVLDEAPAPALAHDLNGILRLLTCGSVDDGKSTLIGRLLWDASDLYEDQRETLARAGRTAANGTQPDFSLLVDGLVAEREQGITIDIAWRYFDTPNRRFVVVDSPGHEQYTRNMASGASHADVAIMLVDARAGIKRQTKRHAAILDLVGVRRRAGGQQDGPRRLVASAFRHRGRLPGVDAPLRLYRGDRDPGRSCAGRQRRHAFRPHALVSGADLARTLEALPTRASDAAGQFRMPVQMVLRGAQDFRGLAGTISAGTVATGDEVIDAESGRRARVARIVTMDGERARRHTGRRSSSSSTPTSTSRAAPCSPRPRAPLAARRIEARLVWLSDIPLDTDHGYLFVRRPISFRSRAWRSRRGSTSRRWPSIRPAPAPSTTSPWRRSRSAAPPRSTSSREPGDG